MSLFQFTKQQEKSLQSLADQRYKLNLHRFDEQDGLDKQKREKQLKEVNNEIQELKELCKIT